ncbi:MAG TPA: hypothetical protein ENJ28_10520 [Gammaproteobacteria bacterium]|nr:hypothetical protein [Gammaproteobacteria bacterium]
MKLSYHISIATMIVTLGICGGTTAIASPLNQANNNRLPAGAEVLRANDLLNRGQHREAAKAYFNAAQIYSSSDRDRLILQAAELAVMISDRALTDIYLSALSRHLNSENLIRYRYIQGQLALLDAQYKEALRLLPKNITGVPEGLQQKIFTARMRAAQSSGDPIILATELILQEFKLKQPYLVKLNHDRIWNQINRLSETNLDKARNNVTHPTLRGWLDLNYLQRISSTDSAQLNRNISKWQRNFPRHPANERANKMFRKTTVIPYRPTVSEPVKPIPMPVIKEAEITKPINPNKPILGGVTPPLPRTIKRVAIILPLTGSLSSIGQSLLSGIKKAQRDHASNIHMRIYDSNSDNINAVYGKAISDGKIDFVIGPFSKDKIAQLSQTPSLPVNTLGLNYIGRLKAATGLYQFGLLPEDETLQVARKMLNKGHKRIAIVVPDSSWGRRLRNSFTNAFTRNGGKAIITINYSKKGTTYNDIKKALLKKKDKIDAIFLAASPSQARAIQPLLYQGELKSIPVYATSHIYSGLANQYRNIKLEGIRYTEIPWILEVSKKGLPQDSKFPRLRALGMDALMVAKGMTTIVTGSALNGRTGQIQIGPDRVLHRQLKWAKFNGGSPIGLSE